MEIINYLFISAILFNYGYTLFYYTKILGKQASIRFHLITFGVSTIGSFLLTAAIFAFLLCVLCVSIRHKAPFIQVYKSLKNA